MGLQRYAEILTDGPKPSSPLTLILARHLYLGLRVVTGSLALLIAAADWMVPSLIAGAQSVVPAKHQAVQSQPELSAHAWAVAVAAKELLALHHTGSYLRYRMHVVDEKGDQTRDLIECKDGSVARLVLRDGRSLTPSEDQAERRRLKDMIASPAAFARHMKNESSSRRIAEQMVKLMPDAMLYSYTPRQPQAGRNGSALQVVLDYKPNPSFRPPSTTAEALTGLEGRMWIDAKSHNLVRMEGTVFQSVNFGWGMIAHVYPGGRLVLEQEDAGKDRWIYTRFTEEVRVRALMVKTMEVQQSIDASLFKALPEPLSYQDAIHLLLNTPLPGH